MDWGDFDQPWSKYQFANHIGLLAKGNNDPKMCARVFSDCSFPFEDIMYFISHPKDVCRQFKNDMDRIRSKSKVNEDNLILTS